MLRFVPLEKNVDAHSGPLALSCNKAQQHEVRDVKCSGISVSLLTKSHNIVPESGYIPQDHRAWFSLKQ